MSHQLVAYPSAASSSLRTVLANSVTSSAVTIPTASSTAISAGSNRRARRL
jgi:hypothetical protein